ncbi:uncharacterized protein [Ptychodera flava]|uniref:uncharacterized protein n=1 Tax=Ptychodera flava TaxID=63121 RepID=UPI00396A6867
MPKRVPVSIVANIFLLIAFIQSIAYGSLYDPHVFPTHGPFMEGWYCRLIDGHIKQSFGVLFGSVSPKSGTPLKYPSIYVGIIRSNGGRESMRSFNAFPDSSDIVIAGKGGTPIEVNPDMKSPPNFTWTSKRHGYFKVTPNDTVFDFTISDIRFRGNLGPPLPWDQEGKGPAGSFDLLPLPLHWYVYSLGSTGDYEWTNLTSNHTIRGTVVAHQEKNWGNGFPPRWVWMQAYNETADSAFAASVGNVDFSFADLPAHLIGYRNYRTGLTLNFLPSNSYIVKTINGCHGKVMLTIWHFRYKVVLEMATAPSTLQECLPGPTEEGFAPVAVESYVAKAIVTVYRLTWMGYKLIDKQYLTQAALEFGGNYICATRNPCKVDACSKRYIWGQ